MKPLRFAILAAAVAATGLAAVPANASRNNGGFQDSAEGRRIKFCVDLKFAYNENINFYNEKPEKRSQWKRTADNIKTLAEGNNCSWAT